MSTQGAAGRTQRFLDERQRPTSFAPRGFLPVDLIAMVSRSGDRLLASDLRTLLAALARVAELVDYPPGDCEGHPCIWPEDIAAALSGPEDAKARCDCPPIITCPSEACATCDYRAGEQEVRR